MVLIIFVAEGMITPLFITENGLKKNLGSLFSIVLFVVFSTIIYFLNDNQYTKIVNGGYIILISAIVYIVTKYLNRININRLAKGKKNYIDDLK
ncbi:hypothetical protein LL033_05305 [Clostridium estertheticum]|uniref:hypothetical protein n=2 Tax=Clostridium estertheticum TaxID=238834 RepID=UPI00227B9153|nr:hypothetical protein [Clostridium estertheticum]WAG56662.1 hypothetical protein LL033_05305 [Clostridium estertheticum]